MPDACAECPVLWPPGWEFISDFSFRLKAHSMKNVETCRHVEFPFFVILIEVIKDSYLLWSFNMALKDVIFIVPSNSTSIAACRAYCNCKTAVCSLIFSLFLNLMFSKLFSNINLLLTVFPACHSRSFSHTSLAISLSWAAHNGLSPTLGTMSESEFLLTLLFTLVSVIALITSLSLKVVLTIKAQM